MQGFKRILFCSDFSEHAAAAFAKAAYLARLESGELTILHVVGPDAREKKLSQEERHELAEEIRARLTESYLAGEPTIKARLLVRRGHPGREILQQLQEEPADLVVLGAQGLSGVKLTLFGSVSEEVSRKAACSCLIVRP